MIVEPSGVGQGVERAAKCRIARQTQKAGEVAAAVQCPVVDEALESYAIKQDELAMELRQQGFAVDSVRCGDVP
ncbi:hypothetical protein D3C80_2172780 [compost metagenome]